MQRFGGTWLPLWTPAQIQPTGGSVIWFSLVKGERERRETYRRAFDFAHHPLVRFAQKVHYPLRLINLGLAGQQGSSRLHFNHNHAD